MPRHVVVDGSNIATEGRALPSLRQLNDAVMAFIEDNPDHVITVVVDATFGHRIDPREVPEFDAAVENNELVSPPAGAIGRGDAFVLTIANKAGAAILSNDSFQEFHGEYPWLFEEGRLIGGKPVPNVGWVFVLRAPVRGPLSRRSMRDAKSRPRAAPKKTAGRPSKEASEPMPVPKVPPPARATKQTKATKATKAAKEPAAATAPAPAKSASAPTGSKQSTVNELLPFLEFVERHPVGSEVEATVDSYSSHGAYASTSSVKAYVPLRYLADPAPRSARDVVALGERRSFVVVSFNPSRRGIDLAVPGVLAVAKVEPPPEPRPEAAPAKRTRKKAAEPEPVKKAIKERKKAAAPEPAPKKATKARKKVAEPEPVKKATRARKKAVDSDVAKTPTRSRKKATKSPDGSDGDGMGAAVEPVAAT